MIKKAEIITILVFLLFVYITDSAKAEITDVEITPDEPTTEDIITVVTFGTETSGPVTVIDSVVNITDSDIALDLTLEVGPYTVMTPWSYSEDIGRLPAGTYDLTVRTIVSSVVTDTYFKTFQVLPEPSMTLDGSGTEQDPWRIKSLEDFNDFAADANYWAGFTRLETDVNLAGRVYERAIIAPDGNNANYDFDGTPFTGIFDGNDHKIIDLTINGGSNKYLGLFGYIGYDSEVKNLGIEGGFINGEFCVGGTVGHSYYGSISNCYYTGDVNGSDMYVGGLVGYVEDGNVSNCYSTGAVSGDYRYGGGLVGVNGNGSISDCYTTSDVNGSYAIGGLVGLNSGIITSCSFAGSVSGQSELGGLVFSNYGSVYFCYSKGDVNGTSSYVGGLIGKNPGNVYHCYSTGFVSGEFRVGGLMGYNNGSVSHCYSTGNVSGDVEVGGLMGSVEEDGNVSNCYATGDVNGDISVGGLIGDNIDGIISNCYSTGDVSGNTYVGGLIGTNLMDINFNSSISNCFWDTDNQTHGVIESIGGNAGTVINVLGLPTSQLHQQSTFTDWDFINVWNIGENQTYPYLRIYLPSDINKDGIVNFLDLSITANQWLEGE